jgi:heme-degrading monooxygenase HmoA
MLYIFEVHIGPGYTPEQYADAWVRASTLIQRAPGALGTRLHRKIGEPDVLLAIASWESKAARDAMEARPSEQVAAIIAQQTPFVEIRLIGEFDAPEWEVLPPRMAG